MKALTIILAAILSFQMNFLFASSDGAILNKTMNLSISKSLAPTTPKEATFEDISTEATLNIQDLVPLTPVEADFSDNEEVQTIDLAALAPNPPAMADFEELK